MRSYAVAWTVGSGPACLGKVELGADVCLRGADPSGRAIVMTIARRDVVAVHRAEGGERLRGRRTLVLVRSRDAPIALASLDGPGTAHELHERLASFPLVQAS